LLQSNVEIKRWGPLPPFFLGFWHHVAFTVRFARVFSKTASGPAVAITQAFMFLDGETVGIRMLLQQRMLKYHLNRMFVQQDAGTTFLSLDIENNLKVTSGLTHLFVGGPSPDTGAQGYSLFIGSMDNIRFVDAFTSVYSSGAGACSADICLSAFGFWVPALCETWPLYCVCGARRGVVSR
jgi:hypothetical protein